MKRLLALILSIAIALSLVSCKNIHIDSVSSSPTVSQKTTVSNTNSEKPKDKTSSAAQSETAQSDVSIETPPEYQDTSSEDEYDRPIGQSDIHIYRDAFDQGCCRSLRGKVYVYCFFVDDGESSWTAAQAHDFLEQHINPALNFLSTQAVLWNIDLSFDVTSFCNETADFSLTYNGTVNKDLMRGGSTKDILLQIAENMGYTSDTEFSKAQDKKHNGADTIYLTLLNKKGRSYTRHIYTQDVIYYLDDDYPEHSIIFAQDIDAFSPKAAPGERTATVAHEILHLFGAEDYYGTIRLPLAQRYYNYDIMTLSTRLISWLKVMDMTAFSIGWTDTVPELCYDKTWQNGRFDSY